MNQHPLFILMVMTILIEGCSMAPKYTRPPAEVPDHWPSEKNAGRRASETNAPYVPDLVWQEFITDEKLRRVIDMTLKNNYDLRIAALNVQRVRALYGVQKAQLLPLVNATVSTSKQHTPASAFGGLSKTGGSIKIERYDVNLGMSSWEIDFFGRIRSLKAHALEEYLASEQARRSAQILLISSVASAWLTLAADQENLNLAKTTLKAQQESFNLIKSRHDLGLLSELDLRRAQSQVEAARGDVARYTQRMALDQNALNFISGTPVPQELLPSALVTITGLEEISAGLPSDVLLKRPDVLQSENLLRATYADIGAARAAFFPRITLTAAFGTASGELTGLFKEGSEAWNYSPQGMLSIFDARTWAGLKITKVQKEIALTQYQKTIQNAFREVADALVVQSTADEQLKAQQDLVSAVSETYRLSGSRYEKGIDSYLSVLDAQRSLYTAQQGLVSLRLAKSTNQVRLYAVLGGGWQTEADNSASTNRRHP